MKKGKIAIVYNTSWYIVNFRTELIQKLQAIGYDVITIAPVDDSTEKLVQMGCIHCHYSINRKGSNIIEEIKTFFSLFVLYKKIKPDVVLQFTVKPVLYGSFVAGLLGVRVINNITGLGTLFTHENWLTDFSKILFRYSMKKADKIFFQNEDDLNYFLNKLKLVKIEQIDLLPGSGVNLEKFRPMEKTKLEKKFIFLLIARLIWDKGIREYIEASRILKSKNLNFECQLLGHYDFDTVSGIKQETVKKWEDEGLVRYLGSCNDVRKFIKNADSVVLPSFYREGTSRSLLESAAMAKPIITTDHPGCRCLVDEGINGYLCKVKDGFDLAIKMEKMLSNSEQVRLVMGIKSREKVEKHYDINIVIQKYIQNIGNLLGDRETIKN